MVSACSPASYARSDVGKKRNVGQGPFESIFFGSGAQRGLVSTGIENHW